MSAPPFAASEIDVTVITLDPVDYGAGATDRVVFAGCKYVVDNGTLNVFLAEGRDFRGNVATFAAGQWASVIRGRVVALAENGAPPAGQHKLEAVRP